MRKDERYIEMVKNAVKKLNASVGDYVTDYFGKVFIEGALEKYETSFLAIVEADEIRACLKIFSRMQR
jgi:hypothetical protein